MSRPLAASLLSLCLVVALPAQDWQGKWFTNRGVLELEVKDGKATSTYGDKRKHVFDGTIAGPVLTFEATEGESRLSGKLELPKDKHAFTGTWTTANNKGTWRGWRLDPAAVKAKQANVAGPWRTSWGLMELEVKGNKLTGGFGAQGWSTVEGEVQGRRLTLNYQAPFGSGTFTADVEPDGSAAYGGIKSGEREWTFIAQRLEGYTKNVAPKPGAIVQGLAKNRLTYYLRAPKNWKATTPVPLVVILHGSNMGAKPYVESVTSSELGERCLILGVDGEQWQDWSEPNDPRHNYTYVNFMGRSTYQGYPNTDRESPALVAALLQDLRAQCKPSKVFVGGHSQGGFLTWFFALHYPELVDGVFPISSGMVMQCEPDVFSDAALRTAQRKVAIAVVHGQNDPTVPFTQGEASWRSCKEHGFPMLRLFRNQAGHGFSSLPWLDAVHWLETMSSDDAQALLTFADQRIDDQGYRDASGALVRLRSLKLQPAVATKVKELAARIDSYGEQEATRFAGLIEKGEGGPWIDEWLKYRDQFEFADCAVKAMAGFAALRAKQEKPAQDLIGSARKLFNEGNRNAGWAKYQELVEQCWASSWYQRVQGWLRDRR